MPDVWHAAAGGQAVSQEQLEDVASELIMAARGISVWLLFGEMGSGKTTLVKAIGKMRGIQDLMSSPTFPIVNEYGTADGSKIYHFDLYRILNEKEVVDIGTQEYFDSNELCLVEWPEKLGAQTPEHHFDIRIIPAGPLHRKIEYQIV
jgi:tRNA threonylcarbamoyladenosine biosynthesis protein TsaE